MKKERPKVCLNVYLLLQQNNKILLSLRQNTGYEDNKWSLVAGHCESKEAATQALIREAQEEIGITIDPKELEVSHVMHRQTDRENIDMFISCKKWNGSIANIEPEKCGELEFFELDKLPENTIPYIKDALIHIKNGKLYSEQGW